MPLIFLLDFLALFCFRDALNPLKPLLSQTPIRASLGQSHVLSLAGSNTGLTIKFPMSVRELGTLRSKALIQRQLKSVEFFPPMVVLQWTVSPPVCLGMGSFGVTRSVSFCTNDSEQFRHPRRGDSCALSCAARKQVTPLLSPAVFSLGCFTQSRKNTER